jgi:hypothetical protein
VQHVAGPVASPLGYGRRVPSPSRVVPVALCALVAVVGGAACGSSSSRATGFCAAIRHSSPAFDSVDRSGLSKATAAFDRIAARAPAPVATDLHVVVAFRARLFENPGSISKDPSIIVKYGASTKRVDAYLHDHCGVHIPPRGPLP